MTMTKGLFADLSNQSETVTFEPTKRAGIARLESFASRTGEHYVVQRNYDLGPTQRSTVSALSPWIRHRLITEEEVLTRALARHNSATATKFIQEVFWRGYFKGWLQQHPSVWNSYQLNLQTAQNELERNLQRKANYLCAFGGNTGIACFDHWCHELKATGYLHNHARMWFASIWIFTLRLPWELGAQFFLNYLIDGDPASNTLSWRWVGGLHTKGKTYLARSSNIAKYTEGAFDPVGQLAQTAQPLIDAQEHSHVPFASAQAPAHNDYLLLVTEEDCRQRTFISKPPKDVLGLVLPRETDQGVKPHAFKKGAVTDAVMRLGSRDNVVKTNNWGNAVIEAAQKAGTTQVVTAFAPIGPVSTRLASLKPALAAEGITLHQHHRPYDASIWPHATKGFFKLKKTIPTILSDLGFTDAKTPQPCPAIAGSH